MHELMDVSKFIDITREFNPSMPVWPSSEKFALEVHRSHEKNGVQVASIHMNLHTGTHMDSPLHFVAGTEDIAEMGLSVCCGAVWVQDCGDVQRIDRNYLEALDFPSGMKRVLFKTRNSKGFRNGQEFDSHYAALTTDGAQWAADRKLILVGIDGPSIELYHGRDYHTHRVILNQKMAIIEGLDLSQAKTGLYTLLAMPLKIKDAEASPVRAVLIPA